MDEKLTDVDKKVLKYLKHNAQFGPTVSEIAAVLCFNYSYVALRIRRLELQGAVTCEQYGTKVRVTKYNKKYLERACQEKL